MQGGRLLPDDKQSAKPRNGMARWRFADGRALLLTEAGKERKAGVWVVAGDPLTQVPLAGLGVDADAASRDQLVAALGVKNQRLHGFLRDQHGLAGLGRMQANEICHRAKLSAVRHDRQARRRRGRPLLLAVHDSLADALAH